MFDVDTGTTDSARTGVDGGKVEKLMFDVGTGSTVLGCCNEVRFGVNCAVAVAGG